MATANTQLKAISNRFGQQMGKLMFTCLNQAQHNIQQQTGSRITRSAGARTTQKRTSGRGRGRWGRKATGTSGSATV